MLCVMWCGVIQCVCVCVAVSMCVFHTLLCLQCFSVINWLTESAELAEPTLGYYTHTKVLLVCRTGYAATHVRLKMLTNLSNTHTYTHLHTPSSFLGCGATAVEIKGIVTMLSVYIFLSVSINRPTKEQM